MLRPPRSLRRAATTFKRNPVLFGAALAAVLGACVYVALSLDDTRAVHFDGVLPFAVLAAFVVAASWRFLWARFVAAPGGVGGRANADPLLTDRRAKHQLGQDLKNLARL